MTNDKKILRFFLDSEFNEHACKFAIDPISIALVPEDPAQPDFYRISSEFDAGKITPWLEENVIVHLLPPEERQTNEAIRDGIAGYLKQFKADDVGRVEIWALNGSTDNVVLANFFGGLMGLREAFKTAGLPSPHFRELKELTRITETRLPPPENAHDCLADALWTRDAFKKAEKSLKPEHKFLLD